MTGCKREGRLLCGALDQHPAAQRFERDKHLALRHGLAQMRQQGAERYQLARDRQPVQDRLLQRCRAAKLLREQLANAVEERIAHGQKGSHIAAEQLVNRFRHQLECQADCRRRGAPAHCTLVGVAVMSLASRMRWQALVVETGEWQRAHGCAAAFERPQLGGLLAAGQQQTALVLALAQCADQLAILGVARAIGARRRARLHE